MHHSLFRPSITCVLLMSLASLAHGAASDAGVAAGEKIFNVKCRDCHALDKRRTGPALAGAIERRSAEWLRAWLNDPVSVAKSDPEAVKLKAIYQTQMPKLGLSKQEIDALLAFLAAHPGAMP